MGLKVCCRCKKSLPTSEFYKHASTRDGLQAFCNACKRLYSAEYRKRNAERISERRKKSGEHRRSHLKRRYNLSEEQYRNIQEAQKGVCGICGATTKLFVDHCHTAETVRGLLCQHCNSMLGFAKDNVTVLRNAIEYLKKYSS